MKKTPSFWKRIGDIFSPTEMKRKTDRFIDDLLVRSRLVPERVDGRGMILHMSDTPTAIYPYLARLLRRVNPSVVVHTGDLADNIKLELYAGEEKSYQEAMIKLISIITAPHREVYLFLGNHDKIELLPRLPKQCSIFEDCADFNYRGALFSASHYYEKIQGQNSDFKLFGHAGQPKSYDEGARYYLNGVESMWLIDPIKRELRALPYPSRTDKCRTMRVGHGIART